MVSVGKWAFVLAAPHSGSGKTTVTLAILAALRRRGLTVQPFKVGPDFIDPGLHTFVSGTVSRNLDGWMLSRDVNRTIFARCLQGADGAVVEGVMGLFDGYDGASEAGSTAEMAKWLELPVILVVDARSMARSVAALVHGFCSFDPHIRCAGVIFNRVGSEAHLEFLREAMTVSHPNLAVLGGLPREDTLRLPERHLGLVTAEESPLDQAFVDQAARWAETHLDLNRLLTVTTLETGDLESIASQAAAFSPTPSAHKRGLKERPVIAVARDAVFCFYYQDNLDLLESFGARLHFFSPLAGETIPQDASALYLGGGYPEVHAKALRKNQRFFDDLKHFASSNRPIYAECGGLMVLSQSIELLSGEKVPMAGLLPFSVRMLSRRKALGYVEVVLTRSCLLGEPGMRMRGHEFHYSEIDHLDNCANLSCCYRLQARKYRLEQDEGYQVGSVLASYVHLHWGSAPQAAAFFIDAARKVLCS